MPFSSFFSYVWTNPFASLPFGSLSTDLQRRFLSWVLKRSLGRFVRAGGLDVGRIQSQIGQGRVEIEGLELDTDEINALIPPTIPLQVTSGTLAKVVAQLPFPNLWSAPLQITLDTLYLDLTLASPPSSSGSKGKARDTSPIPLLSPGIDLASSVTSAAEEFLHDELDAYEEAELDRSIRQSLILSQTDPFNTSEDVPPGGFPFPSGAGGTGGPLPPNVESTTILAGLLERVLTRLEFKVNNIHVRVSHNDSKHGAVFELRVGEIRYADESTSEALADGRRTVRVVKVAKVELYMSPLPAAPETPSRRPFFAQGSRSSSASSTSSSSTADSNGSNSDDDNDMFMSMAVADLRSSVAATDASSATVYMSAVSEAPMGSVAKSRIRDTAQRAERPKSPTPTGKPEKDDARLILSFGTEDIVLRMSTTRPAPPSTELAEPPSVTSAGQTGGTSLSAKSLPSIDFEISIGTVASLLLPDQVATILSSLQFATAGKSANDRPADRPAAIPEAAQPKMNASFRLKAFYGSLVYDLTAATDSSFADAAKAFWSRPSVTDLPLGHLKLRLDTLQAAYRFAGFTPGFQVPQRERRTSSRRALVPAKGLPPASVSISLSDASLFEYLASAPSGDADSPPGGAFPVLIFDPNLLNQYERSSPALGKSSSAIPPPVFPEFDGIDWRNSGLQRRGGPGEKVWRVKQKGRGVLKGAPPPAAVEEATPVIVIEQELCHKSPANIQTQPIHLFLDLSLVERLLPVLRHISPAVKRTEMTAPSSPIRPQRPVPLQRQSESFVLDDLNAQAALPRAVTVKSDVAILQCPMLRLSIRCPAPPNRRGTWGDGAHLRSGIVTLDLHGLSTKITGSSPPSGVMKGKAPKASGETTVEWQTLTLFFSRVPSSKSSAFLVLGPLSPDPGDIDSVLLLPTVRMKNTQESAYLKTSTITCQIPSVQAKVRQETFEGLQFFADDLTHWLDGAFGDGSRPKPRDELKMIGSRFFGSKASSSTSSSMIEEDDDEATSATVIRVQITETDVALHVPRSGMAGQERTLSLKASDLSATVESNTSGRQETAIILTIMDAEFADRSDAIPKRILGRTTPLTLTLQNHPIVHLRFSSLANKATGTKETSIKAVLSSFTISVQPDLSWIQDLAAFAKTPEGVFEDVVPSEITRIALEVYDGSIHVTPPTMPGAAVVVLGILQVKTDLVSDAEENTIDISLGRTALLLVDDVGSTVALSPGKAAAETWKIAGYAQLVELSQVDVRVWREIGGGDIAVDLLSAQVIVTACADSLAILGPFVADLTKLAPAKPAKEKPKSPTTLDQTINVFASIEEDAFNQVPDLISGADLIEDDLPTNLDYLDQATRRTEVKADRHTGETLRTWQATGDDDHNINIHSEVNGDAIRILAENYDDGGVESEADYWDNTSVTSRTSLDDTLPGEIRLRIHDCSLNILLHDGYDWQRTRKAIEDEIKSVRRKLERIRQLLASGQTADESIENTRSVLFNSVYIGLDQSQQMDHAALLAAIDEELGDLGNDASSVSSWQTDFPAGHPGATARGSSKKPRLRGKKLVRSKKPQIEIALEKIRAEVDLYPGASATASRVNVTVVAMEILDHIKTSTWKKFLTEMKADGRGNVRETGADMVRVELVGVRPSLPSPEEEYRLRAKILPLKLHVDQDALDFLKRFFSFTIPGITLAAVEDKPSAEPFLQHVEIFPIELKLDYKPKRVDFAALREGRTMELMNFFHFDGAEMTLRHVTLSGVSGFSRLSTTLQDIWTPDVKANQLADVISGVSPIRSMVNVGSGVADLILLPIEQYRKDGRLARGVQRGTNSFVRSTALEMMKLGAKLATGTQVILEKAEGVLGGKIGDKEVVGEVPWQVTDPEGDVSSEDEVEVVSRYANQPGGAREGVQAAYQSLSRNVNAAAQTILAVPMEVYERSGDNGPLKAVVRAVPIAVLKPMIGASEAVSKTLWGMRNSLDPQGKEELGDKYKSSKD